MITLTFLNTCPHSSSLRSITFVYQPLSHSFSSIRYHQPSLIITLAFVNTHLRCNSLHLFTNPRYTRIHQSVITNPPSSLRSLAFVNTRLHPSLLRFITLAFMNTRLHPSSLQSI